VNKFKTLLLIISIVILCIITSISTIYINRKDIKWIDLKYVYENFDFKKELEIKLSKSSNQRKVILDSLELQLRFYYNQLSSKDTRAIRNYELLKDNYLRSKDKFEEDNLQQKMDYESQINKQLNQLVKDYAIEKNIDILLGADGNGVLMFANESMNSTNDVLSFINKKYAGKKD